MNATTWVLTAWAACLAVTDYRQRRLPNELTLGAATAAIVYLFVRGSSVLGASWISAGTAGLGALIVLLPFFRLGWLGAGDIKLMSAIGFLGGVQVLLTTFVFSSMLAFPFALWLRLRRNPDANLPQGLFIGLGLILAALGNTAAVGA